MSGSTAERLSAGELEPRIRARGLTLGLPLRLMDCAASTNREAMLAAEQGAPHGAMVVADEQTAGRGRSGRVWLSPPGVNLYLSLVLRPKSSVEALASLALAAGLAVAESAERVLGARSVGIKWPNDVVVGERKLAGVLVESAVQGGRCRHVVVGIGLNVHQAQFDEAIRDQATSLAREGAVGLRRSDVLLELLDALSRRLEQHEAQGIDGLIDLVRERDTTPGREVLAAGRRGRAVGVASDGRLLVDFGGGEPAAVAVAEVLWR